MTDLGTPIGEPRPIDLSAFAHVFQRPSWETMGACVNRPTDVWFSNKPADIFIATTICREVCPVRWRCLADNIDVPFGVFGGLTANQRKVIREEFPVVISQDLLQLLIEDKETG